VRRVALTLVVLAVLALATSASADPGFLLQWGGAGAAPGQFGLAHHLAVTTDGRVYVGDLLNNRIQGFDRDGAFVEAWNITLPDGIAVAPDGRFYVCGQDRVVRYGARGAYELEWGTTGSDPGQFRSPIDVAVDAAGFVYVTDWQNHRVQKFTADGGFVRAWGSEGAGDGQFMLPFGIAWDPAGSLLVADGWTNRIQRFTTDGAFLAAFGSAGTGPGMFDSPGRPCVDPDGFVIVPDAGNHRIEAFRADGSFVTAWGSAGTGPGQFNHPTCVATDGLGNIYVMDKDNSRIQKFGAVATASRGTSWGELKARWR
jgi:DNA-binding beta-propeller fold protein YncE